MRFLVRDDETQFEKANRLIKREVSAKEDVFASLIVLLETEWVLRRHSLQKTEIIQAFFSLLDAAEIQLEDEAAVEETFFIWKDSAADFADCLIGAHNRRAGCRATATFGTNAVKLPAFAVL